MLGGFKLNKEVALMGAAILFQLISYLFLLIFHNYFIDDEKHLSLMESLNQIVYGFCFKNSVLTAFCSIITFTLLDIVPPMMFVYKYLVHGIQEKMSSQERIVKDILKKKESQKNPSHMSHELARTLLNERRTTKR